MMTKHIDPVCGMEIDSSQAFAEEKVDGESYYFCSVHCRESFLMVPGAYLRAHKPETRGRSGHGCCCG